MEGFAVNGRVPRTSPRIVRSSEPPRGEWTSRHRVDVVELVDVGDPHPWTDRWAAIRDRWSEMTFYLFDPQGWR